MNLNKNEYDSMSEEEITQRMRQILEDHKEILNPEVSDN